MKMSRTSWLGGLALLAALTAATMATAQQRAAVRIGSPLTGAGLPAPFGATVDGNDNFWVSNFAAPNGRITQLCGARTENCRPGFKIGVPMAPPGGYVGGGLQMLTGIAIGPAGDVWSSTTGKISIVASV